MSAEQECYSPGCNTADVSKLTSQIASERLKFINLRLKTEERDLSNRNRITRGLAQIILEIMEEISAVKMK